MDTKTLDPAFSGQLSERYALYMIYNTLVAYDKDFNIVPDLAASWDIGDDGKSITFHLQPNVKFHDGTPCDAAAVKWNLDRILDPSANSPCSGSSYAHSAATPSSALTPSLVSAVPDRQRASKR